MAIAKPFHATCRRTLANKLLQPGVDGVPAVSAARVRAWNNRGYVCFIVVVFRCLDSLIQSTLVTDSDFNGVNVRESLIKRNPVSKTELVICHDLPALDFSGSLAVRLIALKNAPAEDYLTAI